MISEGRVIACSTGTNKRITSPAAQLPETDSYASFGRYVRCLRSCMTAERSPPSSQSPHLRLEHRTRKNSKLSVGRNCQHPLPNVNYQRPCFADLNFTASFSEIPVVPWILLLPIYLRAHWLLSVFQASLFSSTFSWSTDIRTLWNLPSFLRLTTSTSLLFLLLIPQIQAVNATPN